MPGAHISIFISYSHRNGSFVDNLEADLKMRKFSTWVDREKTEGTQAWKHILQDAIDQCNIVLIVLSPVSILSRYVQIEYSYAFRKGKRAISLEYQQCQELPINLKDIPRISFTTNYEQGLGDLLKMLGYVDTDPTLKPNQAGYLEQARKAQKVGEWRKAAGFWQVLQDLEPKNGEVLLSLEQCWREQGKITGVGNTMVYLVGYYKAMKFFSTIIMTAISGFVTFVLIWFIFPALHDFNREQKSQLFFNLISHSFWVGRQINAGLIIGSIIAFCLFFLTHSVSSKGDRISRASLSGLFGGAGIALFFWSILAFFAWIFNWGWGFSPAWYWSLFGLAIGAATATGLGTSLVIWVKGKPLFY